MSADSQEELVLGAGFPPASREQWRRLVEGVIGKGLTEPTRQDLDRRFAQRLVTTTYDGIEIQPLYDAESVRDLPDPGLPGLAPFVRGRTPLGAVTGGWDVCQRVEIGPASAGDAAVVELEGGATSLWLGLGQADEVGAGTLERALEGVLLDLVAVRLDAGARTEQAAAALVDILDRRDVRPDQGRGTLGFDPIGWSLQSGVFGAGFEEASLSACSWAARCARSRPPLRALAIDGCVFHQGGASDAEELGTALAVGARYLRDLVVEEGLTTDAAFSQVELRLAATTDQFSTIAKLRAARRLWNRMGEVAGAGELYRVPPTHAVTSPAMLSVYDPWVNLLRTTIACFAAGVGGADAVTTLPYDYFSAGHQSSDLGRRLARNIQALLLEESHVGSVVDLAGGSWYVESLTDQLTRRAWEWFQTIEDAGGILAAVESGLVRDRFDSTWRARSARLAHGSDPLTGVSEFPNVAEPIPDPDRLQAVLRNDGPGMPFRRWPAAFEALRADADRHAAGGGRPCVLMATIGSPANYTARLTFAQNLFGVAGIDWRQPADQARPQAWGEVLADKSVRLACICSDDRTYVDHAAETARQLKAAGAHRVYLAGRPGDHQSEWEEAGVDEFIYMGVDRLEVLARALEAAGVR